MHICGMKKVTTVRMAIIKIWIYSPIKMRAKPPALYSMLNPETSSDSPSARSKGVRFNSARMEMNHRGIRGRSIRNFGTYEVVRKREKSNDE